MTKSEATKGKQGPAARRTKRHRRRHAPNQPPVLSEAQRVIPKAGPASGQAASLLQASTRQELTRNLNVMPDLKRAGIISGGLLILLIILSVFL